MKSTIPSEPSVAPVESPPTPYAPEIHEALPDQHQDLTDIMRHMIAARVYSTRLFNLQRQGRAGTMAPVDGSEAVAAGAAAGLDPSRDWIFPQYRELVALGAFGDSLIDSVALYNLGHPAGGAIPEDVHVFPTQISLATQIPHAVGMAWGMKLKGEQACTLVFFGDGSSSEGDFYEAANLAGVRKAPVIFVLVNNGWAISTPTYKQTAAESFAHKAMAFGMPGVQVDGGDPLAMRSAVSKARQRALSGVGPTLIEAVTFRLAPHTTADDPTRYVPPEDLEEALVNDPIRRFATHLESLGVWNDELHTLAEQAADKRFDLAWERAEATPVVPESFFDHVYETPTARMVRQRREMQADLAAREEY